MRTIHELLKEVLEITNSRSRFAMPGICYIVKMAIPMLSIKEEDALINYIHKYAKPNIFEKRFYCTNGVWDKQLVSNNAYYWEPYKWEQRIKWLKKHIEKTAPKGVS